MEYAPLFSTEGVLLPASDDIIGQSIYREKTLSLKVNWSGGFLDFVYVLRVVKSLIAYRVTLYADIEIVHQILLRLSGLFL